MVAGMGAIHVSFFEHVPIFANPAGRPPESRLHVPPLRLQQDLFLHFFAFIVSAPVKKKRSKQKNIIILGNLILANTYLVMKKCHNVYDF